MHCNWLYLKNGSLEITCTSSLFADFTDIFKHWHISKIVIMTKTSVVSFLWLQKMNVCQIYPINNTVWILLYRYLPSWYIKCAYFLLTFKCIVYNMNNVALYLKGACYCCVLIPFSQFFNALLIKIFGRYQYYNQISRNISPLSKNLVRKIRKYCINGKI